jgi:phosphatidylglycerophosphate synthase
MVAAALIVVSEAGGIFPLSQFAGLSLLKRAVLTAQKAGANTCYIYAPVYTHLDLQADLCDDARITSKILWLPAANGSTQVLTMESSTWLVIPVDTVFRPPVVREFFHWTETEPVVVVTTTALHPLLALLSREHVDALLVELAAGTSLADTKVLAAGRRMVTPATPGAFCRQITSLSSIDRLEYDLLLSLENPRDGAIDTHFNRKLSRPITHKLLRTSLTPNQVTVLSGVVGLLGALCFFPGGYWGPVLGALLLQFSVVLDCCDGEIARVKHLESPLGDWLDIVCDTAVSIAIFIGIGMAVWKNGDSRYALELGGMLAMGGAFAFPLVTLAEKTEVLGEQRNGWEDSAIKKLLATLTTRDFSVVVVASALTGTLGWFLWGAAIGAHVFWIVLAWLLWRAGRFEALRSVWE